MTDAQRRGPMLARAIIGRPRPCALVDLDAFDRNLARLIAPLGPSQTLRIASKSLRVPALIQRALSSSERVQGVLAFHVKEASLLFAHGIDDVFIAYPPAPEDILPTVALAAKAARLWATVDGLPAAKALSDEAMKRGVVVNVAIDIDLSLRVGPVHLGVRRSPIRSAEQAVALGRLLRELPGVQLTAVLAYEAQVAGVRDHTGSIQDVAVRAVKRRSKTLAEGRRLAVVRALRADGHAIDVVNGGGTGSVFSTGRDPSVTEVSAGSGLLCPHLFDGYNGLPLEPAAFFALAVVRESDAGFVTCYGGGFSASGAAGTDRLPVPWWPVGLKSLDMEGFGEVQTPFVLPKGLRMDWGDTVLCRHGKSGELFEHMDDVSLIHDGRMVQVADTLRGSMQKAP